MASIPFARKGDVIGKLHKPIKGENGISVRGRIINAPPVRDVEVKILKKKVQYCLTPMQFVFKYLSR